MGELFPAWVLRHFNMDKTQKLFNKGYAAFEAGNHRDAEKLFRKIIKHNPQHLDAHFFLGSLYAQNKEYDLALKFLKTAATLKPDSLQIKNNLGNVYRGLNRTKEAIAQFENILKNNPNFLPALQNLGHCNIAEKNWQGARDCLEKVIAKHPQDADALFALAECHMHLGDSKQAASLFNRSKEVNPSLSDTVQLRLAFMGLGDLPDRHPDDASIANYKAKAANWDKDINRKDHHYRGPEIIKVALAKHLGERNNLRTLDIGCGTGACGSVLKPVSRQLVGMDLSPDMLEIARKKRLYDRLDEAELTAYLESCTEDYDLVVGAGVFILIGDLTSSFASVARILRNDGLFVLTLYQGKTDDVSLRHNFHFAHSRSHIENVAQKAGLTIVEIAETVHETEDDVDQAGYSVTLQKPA